MVKRILKGLILTLLIATMLFMAVQVFLIKGTPGKTIKPNNPTVNYSSTPTLLIPGWVGNSWTYSKFISQVQKQNIAQNALIVRVSPDCHVDVTGSLKNKKNPLIQVIYTWNYDTTFKPQVKELRAVLETLYDQYHVSRLNVIGHSYGGTEFIHVLFEDAHIRQSIQLKKVILLVAPVEESFGTRIHFRPHLFKKSQDDNYKTLLKESRHLKLSLAITFYNWMGHKPGSTTTDGEVPTIQSLMLKTLLHHQKITYYQKIFTNTTHVQLHQKMPLSNKSFKYCGGKITNGGALWRKSIIKG